MASPTCANTSIAYGDLAAAALATIGGQFIGAGTGNYAQDLLTLGGVTVLASQVADIVHPRIMTMLDLTPHGESDLSGQVMSAGIAAGSALALLSFAVGGAPEMASIQLAGVIGLAVVGGRIVSDKLFKSALPTVSTGQTPVVNA